MLQRLSSREPLPCVNNQKFLDQVNDQGRALFELVVIEVVLGLLDLGKDLASVGTLEWQVAAHEHV